MRLETKKLKTANLHEANKLQAVGMELLVKMDVILVKLFLQLPRSFLNPNHSHLSQQSRQLYELIRSFNQPELVIPAGLCEFYLELLINIQVPDFLLDLLDDVHSR